MVFGFSKVIVTGPPATMKGLTRYMLAGDDLKRMARYYDDGMPNKDALGGAIRPDMHPSVAAALGLADGQKVVAEPEKISALLAGRRTDGALIEGKHYAPVRQLPVNERTGERRMSYPIGSYVFSPSPDKSISAAWALSGEDERAQILTAVRDASREAMAYLSHDVGRLRLGDGGEKGTEDGHVTWVEFQHLVARRTRQVDGVEGVEFITKRDQDGDPQLHMHIVVPNVVVGVESGKIGSLDTAAMHGFLRHEVDGVFHAALARNLRERGFQIDRNERTGSARMPIIPQPVNDQLSKMTKLAEHLARTGIESRGEDWSNLSSRQREKLTKGAADQERGRIGKDDDPQFESWRAQAERKWASIPETFREPEKARLDPVPESERLGRIYRTAAEILDRRFRERAVISHWEARGAIAQATVEHGYHDRSDIDRVTAMLRNGGISSYGEKTRIIWGREDDGRRISITTGLHADQEAEFIRLAREAATDRSAAIPEDLLERALVATGGDYSDEHGRAQLAAIRKLGSGGRFGVLVAASGAGKTESLKLIVRAGREAGLEFYGGSLAWKQADALTDAGIEQHNVYAFSVLIERLRSGDLVLGSRDVLTIDEWSMVGTPSGLELLRQRERMGFSIMALGDDYQIGAVNQPGDIIDLSRRALGRDMVSEIETTRRQESDREKEIARLLRHGLVGHALDMKREDGTAEMADGPVAVVRQVARLYRRYYEKAGEAPIVLAPTNREAHEVAVGIRAMRRRMGLLGRDARVVCATDGERNYDLPIAIGDQLRLFKSIGAKYRGGGGGAIGRNGSIVEVVGIDPDGLTLQARSGKVGTVPWERLEHKSGRIHAAYGYSHTIHTGQGASARNGILALVDGSKGIDHERGYSGLTRHREDMHLVTNRRAETAEVRRRRAVNDTRPVEDEDRWAAVAGNLAWDPDRDTATAMIERLDIRISGTAEPAVPDQVHEIADRFHAPPPQPTSPTHEPPQVVTSFRPQTHPQVTSYAQRVADGLGYAGQYEDIVTLEYLHRLERVRTAGIAEPDHDRLREAARTAVDGVINATRDAARGLAAQTDGLAAAVDQRTLSGRVRQDGEFEFVVEQKGMTFSDAVNRLASTEVERLRSAGAVDIDYDEVYEKAEAALIKAGERRAAREQERPRMPRQRGNREPDR